MISASILMHIAAAVSFLFLIFWAAKLRSQRDFLRSLQSSKLPQVDVEEPVSALKLCCEALG